MIFGLLALGLVVGRDRDRKTLPWGQSIQCGCSRKFGSHLLTNTAAPFFEKLGFARIDRSQVPDDVRASRGIAATMTGEWTRARS